MKFRENLQSASGIETILTKLSKDIEEIANLNVSEHIVDELLKGERKNTDGLELVLYSTITGKEAASKTDIEKLKEKNEKFKSICIRMAIALENIKKAKKK